MLILSVLLAFPPCYPERHDPDRIVRLGVLAEAIGRVSESLDDAAGLVTILEAESAGCWSVATGSRHGGNGWGPWQLEPGSRRVPPFFGEQLSDLTHAAGEALWLWRHSYRCGPALSSRFESYAGLPCIAWRGAAKRVANYRWVYWRLANFSEQ